MNMPSVGRITGPGLTLRLIQPDDAEYVYDLRRTPAYNRYLSQVTGTAEDQRRWIEAYKQSEAEGRAFYYVIERHDGTRCGVVRLYDLEGTRFTWGSWILDHNKPPKAALESAVLSFGLGFRQLGLQEALVEVDVKNTHAEAFYRRFNMQETGRVGHEIHFRYTAAQYEADYPRHAAVLGMAPAR